MRRFLPVAEELSETDVAIVPVPEPDAGGVSPEGPPLAQPDKIAATATREKKTECRPETLNLIFMTLLDTVLVLLGNTKIANGKGHDKSPNPSTMPKSPWGFSLRR
jgi:hypothetical protein